MAHRQHVKGLIRSYPALQETLDAVVASFDDMTANKPLKYRLAYTADLEATFTPAFKLMLDNDNTCSRRAMTGWRHCSCGISSKRSSTVVRR